MISSPDPLVQVLCHASQEGLGSAFFVLKREKSRRLSLGGRLLALLRSVVYAGARRAVQFTSRCHGKRSASGESVE